MVYVVSSKILTNRLSKVISNVSKNQRMFIPHRFIIQNILVTHKLLYALKRRKSRKISHLTLKLDISMTYDHIKWLVLL